MRTVGFREVVEVVSNSFVVLVLHVDLQLACIVVVLFPTSVEVYVDVVAEDEFGC